MFNFPTTSYTSYAYRLDTLDTLLYETSDEGIDDIQSIADDPNLRSLTATFGTWLSKSNRLTYIVLDGLDEFHDPPKVFQILEGLQHALSTAKLRLLISSWLISLVCNKLRDGDTESIDVVAHNINIDRYVSGRLSEPPFDHGHLTQDEVKSFTRANSRQFKWNVPLGKACSRQLANIYQHGGGRLEVMRSLETTPENLATILEWELAGTKPEYRDDARQLLQGLTFALRELRLEVLADTVGWFDIPQQHMISRIYSRLQSLATVHWEDGAAFVRLFHRP